MCISKTAIAKGAGGGVQIPYVIILGGKVLIHQTFLTFPPPTPTPPPFPHRDVINDRPPLKFLYILTIIFVTLHGGTSREKQG